ncbi:MAG: AAA domain-containing protein [Gammaproteobacteria bacterium]|nr:AAA domain-containing protein [Gammaproteobacteria bacterium]
MKSFVKQYQPLCLMPMEQTVNGIPSEDLIHVWKDSHWSEPWLYEASGDLAMAVNVALNLGKPLLLTGEPGVGKTDLAASVAWQLRCAPPLEFISRSTSEYTDVLYQVDYLGRMQAAYSGSGDHEENTQKDIDVLEFLGLGVLGAAIIKANGPSGIDAIDKLVWAESQARIAERSVVLIDEIDKTPQDFPNDLLMEFDKLRFSIPQVYENRESKQLREFSINRESDHLRS